jgi:arylsulfatase A-like enzyme
MRHKRRIEATIAGAACAALTTGIIVAQDKQKPNIILFYVDDLGWMDLGCQGSKFYETPAIDKLASQGMRFTQGYTAHPRCLPARYAVMTGKFPARGHIFTSGNHLRSSDVTMGEAMQQGGYKTFFIGKWHLTGKDGAANLPKNRGFDVALACGAPGSPATYFYPYRKVKINQELTGDDAIGLNKEIIPDLDKGGQKGEYLTDRITDETIKFIKKQVTDNPKQPFLAYISHYGVHTPFEAKPELVKKYRKKLKNMRYEKPEYLKDSRWGGTTKMRQDNAVYAAMIESVDQSLAKIMASLSKLGIADNTIIMFSGDNGGLSTRGSTTKRTLATTNYPLRTGKGWCYEGGIREAFIVKWPGVTKPGTVNEKDIVIGTDFYPTMLDIAGLPLRPKDHIDGESFKPALEGKNFKRTVPLFWHSPSARPYSTGDYNCSAVREGNYKLIDWYQNNKVELFDLSKDIGENNDLSKSKPEVTTRLLKKLRDWKKEINAEEKPLRLTKKRKK